MKKRFSELKIKKHLEDLLVTKGCHKIEHKHQHNLHLIEMVKNLLSPKLYNPTHFD